MVTKKVLFISGSLGLGHITRDLAIANELRQLNNNIEFSWIASHPASLVIQKAGEKLLPESDQYSNDNIFAEQAAKGPKLNLLKYLITASNDWKKDFEVFKQIITQYPFDLIIGDETYEIIIGFQRDSALKTIPFVMIYDFIGLDAMTMSPVERLGTYIWNRIWSQDYKQGRPPIFDLGLFVGELEDIPDKKFGFMLPGRRDWARDLLKFTGHIISFRPEDYEDKAKLKKKLNYEKAPLIICSAGGTAIGKDLLTLFGKAFPIIKKEFPDLRMILVCGPRISPCSLNVPREVEIREYIPDLYEHFAASDLAIVQGGATSSIELTALKKPFIYFPIEGHFEQAQVAARLKKYNAGVKMFYSQTTPLSLAETVKLNLGKEISYAALRTDGATRAAQFISKLL